MHHERFLRVVAQNDLAALNREVWRGFESLDRVHAQQ
jgi:hypothetical protein